MASSRSTGRAVAFVVGFGLVLNGMVFTRPRQGLEALSPAARSQNLLDAGYAAPQLKTGEAPSFKSQTTSNLNQAIGASVTEETTHYLSSKP
jgi:hypothetical protein